MTSLADVAHEYRNICEAIVRCLCMYKNLEYLLAYSYYCGSVLSVHDGVSVSCAKARNDFARK